ncbi:hypothetical protein G7048_22640 [Diaphorobacter sp. HDW4B]|uniref:hypothetical protein n=1 Tax=Diaphorobacter sp. HDW4B TaxID=2714925 RepID=UPI001408DE0B|nr:hypothetical protein [Diaphorobacter sp. HDW4B]QIL72900.1 hypothetical protein G7048_22640 [Diaphorobacter sp. HDW4B]
MPKTPTPAQQLERAAAMLQKLLSRAGHQLPADISREADDCMYMCRQVAEAAAQH